MDRITDESNLWLKANQMEEGGNYFEASMLYLKDASKCVKQGSRIRAALSCSCAANCLVNMGHSSEARQLYLEAAMLYEQNADSVIGESIRESLWCLQEAHECFLLASEKYRAKQTLDKYVSLTRRVNPFRGRNPNSSSRIKDDYESGTCVVKEMEEINNE